MIKQLRDWNDKRRLSELGRMLWDSMMDDEWLFDKPRYSDIDAVHFKMVHAKTKLEASISYRLNAFRIGREDGPTWDYALSKTEQEILLRRLRYCTNKQLAFQFQLAPFKE